MTTPTVQTGQTMPLDRFWKWLKDHHNCIVRAGSADTALYDDEDLHWHLSEDPDRNLVVQLGQGKSLHAEMVIEPAPILFVQAIPEGTEGQFMFELVAGESEAYSAYYFVLAHGYEDEGHPTETWKH